MLDAENPEDWDRFHALLKDRPHPEDAVRVFYLAVAPQLFGSICQRLDEIGVVDEHARVVLEKPIGHDLASAREVNDAVGQVFDESQIFRIDHYLGKESVQNLLVTRFANTFLEPLWNSRWVDHVQITVAETVGVGGRGGYYDNAGALRDMVQNHLLQLLCLVAMEPPTYVGRETVRDEKLKVLQALRADDAGRRRPRHRPRSLRRRAWSTASPCRRTPTDLGHGGLRTETFVALKAEVQNWRWAGVPFYLRTGKRMDRRALRDRGGLQGAAALDVPREPRASPRPTGCTSRSSPTRACACTSPPRSPGPGGYPPAAGLLGPQLRHRVRRSVSPTPTSGC